MTIPFSVLYAYEVPNPTPETGRWRLARGTPGSHLTRFVTSADKGRVLRFNTIEAMQRFLNKSRDLPKQATIWPKGQRTAPKPQDDAAGGVSRQGRDDEDKRDP
jgi:hypothetical protein